MKKILLYVVSSIIIILIISVIIVLLNKKSSSVAVVPTIHKPRIHINKNLSDVVPTEIPSHAPIVRLKAAFKYDFDRWILHATAGCLVASKEVDNALEWTIVPTTFPYPDSFDIKIDSNGSTGYLSFLKITIQGKSYILAQIVPREKLTMPWRISYESSFARIFQKTSADSQDIVFLGINNMVVGGFGPQETTANTQIEFFM